MSNKEMLSLSKDEFMRTKIIESVKDLLLHTSFEKLTVTSICEHAGIARSSFYHLFTDIHDALDWDVDRLIHKAAEQYPFSTDWRSDLIKQLTAFMELTLEDAIYCRKMGSSMSLVDPGATFFHTRRKHVQMFLDLIELWQGKPADEQCVFEIEFYAGGASTAILNWVCSMKESPETVARNIVGCIPPYMGQVLDSSFAAYQERQLRNPAEPVNE